MLHFVSRLVIMLLTLLLLLLLLLQDLDLSCECWPYLVYWLDIIQLSLQQSGGQPGAAAVAAAQELMKEKHSVFLSRYVFRGIEACGTEVSRIHQCCPKSSCMAPL
jgi:hypothetical protein